MICLWAIELDDWILDQHFLSFFYYYNYLFVTLFLQSFLKNDFVLVSGDIVSNMKLDQVLKEHK